MINKNTQAILLLCCHFSKAKKDDPSPLTPTEFKRFSIWLFEKKMNPSFLIDDFEGQSQATIEDWATKQAYLAMGNLLTVCAIEGIDACPMEGFSPEKYDEILQLTQQGLKSVLVMPIGYRAEGDMFAGFKKVRKDLNQSVLEI